MTDAVPTRVPLPPLTLRRPTNDDVAFITRSWLKSNRDAPMVQHVGNDVYYTLHHRIIERLWRDQRVTWLVACYPTDTTFIYGYACGEATNTGPILHYVYVRRSMRDMGVAQHLVATLADGADRGYHSHLTSGWGHSARKFGITWVYAPYMAFEEFRLA